MHKTPQTISTRSAYKNKYLDVKVDTLEFNGKQWEQVYFTKPNKNGVGVIPMDDSGIYLLYQYRHACKIFLWQIPLGMIDPHKTDIETAKAELSEEAGFEADEFTKIGSVIAEPGMSPQEEFIFVAKGLRAVPNNPADSEIGMIVKHFTFAEVKEMIKKSDIKCGFTLSALMLLKNNYLDF